MATAAAQHSGPGMPATVSRAALAPADPGFSRRKTKDGPHPLLEALCSERANLSRYLRKCGAGADIDDILQDLWIKLAMATTIAPLDPRAYLFRMAANLLLDRQRRQAVEGHANRISSSDPSMSPARLPRTGPSLPVTCSDG